MMCKLTGFTFAKIFHSKSVSTCKDGVEVNTLIHYAEINNLCFVYAVRGTTKNNKAIRFKRNDAGTRLISRSQ